jgi:hypothetical protein
MDLFGRLREFYLFGEFHGAGTRYS